MGSSSASERLIAVLKEKKICAGMEGERYCVSVEGEPEKECRHIRGGYGVGLPCFSPGVEVDVDVVVGEVGMVDG